jgi:hypothetical protein
MDMDMDMDTGLGHGNRKYEKVCIVTGLCATSKNYELVRDSDNLEVIILLREVN